jgi:hypothetical protein
MTELLIPEPSSFKVEISAEKLERYKSPDTDQIPTEMIQAGDNTIYSEFHKLVPIYRKGDKTDCNK